MDATIPDKKYDLTLANPPQLPSRETFDIRECGGVSGWDHIDRALEIGQSRLSADGVILMYILDLLGVSYSTGNERSLRGRAEERGFRFTRLRACQRRVGPGSPVYRELRHIAALYPRSEFMRDAEGLSVITADRAIDDALAGLDVFLGSSIVQLRRL